MESLIAPAKSSIGQTLLQKQGWKPGQGIGPRITLRKLRIQEGKLGRRRTGLDDEDEEIEQQQGAGKHLFAPRDSRLVVYRTKDDKEGLGYEKGRGMGRIPPKETIGKFPGYYDAIAADWQRRCTDRRTIPMRTCTKLDRRRLWLSHLIRMQTTR